jgi:hypothetical protein
VYLDPTDTTEKGEAMPKRIGRTVLLCLLATMAAGATRAQVSTEEPASVLVFPKIIADGNRDTFVQISNSANSMVHANCFYVNGQLPFPHLPPSPFNEPLWQVTDFQISLTAQQPTNWLVAAGRDTNPFEPPCARGSTDCYGTGFDPGTVPSLPGGFAGELVCIEVDAAGFPISGNHLTGEVTLEDLATGDVSKYSAIGLEGFDTNNGDGDLMLGEEYAACPARWFIDHTVDGSEVPAVGAGSSFHTDLTIVPCTQDFLNEVPGNAILNLFVTNEFETTLSTSISVECWADLTLGDINIIFQTGILGTPTAQTRVSMGAVALVAEEFRSTGGVTPLVASSAGNAYAEGVNANPSVIRIP